MVKWPDDIAPIQDPRVLRVYILELIFAYDAYNKSSTKRKTCFKGNSTTIFA